MESKPSLAHHEEVQHFQLEARILSHLRHRHIVRGLDFGWERGMPFLVMEYAPGGTLHQVFPLGKALPISSILPAVLPVASALQFIHNHGVVHCDVKPENVLIGPRNQVWLSDFGIASTVTSTSRTRYGGQKVPGTACYLAPERIHGQTLPASDQYSLALLPLAGLILLLSACVPTALQSTASPSVVVPSPTARSQPLTTACPTAGTVRPAIIPPITLGQHANLLYVEEQGTSISKSRIRRYDIVTGSKTDILSLDNAAIGLVQLSADGQWLLFVTQVGGEDSLQLVRVDGQFRQTLFCLDPTKSIYGLVT